jgi:hypothetical protein
MAKESEDDSSSFLEIDPLRLDQEWVDQPRLFHSYALKMANADAKVDAAKGQLDLAKAVVEKAIRDNPEEFGLEKVTESAIAACVIQQEDYQDALKLLNMLRHKASVLKVAVTALDQRKKALEKLVDLHGQDYFSTPRAKGENREKMEELETSLRRKRTQKRRGE